MIRDNLHKGASPHLFRYARQNRKAQTEGEKVLWEKLRNRRLGGFKFRRQHPIAGFIADFFCLECSLIVEVDGDHHAGGDQAQHDEQRTSVLRELNVKVIRFTNREVLDKTDHVLCEILKHLSSTHS